MLHYLFGALAKCNCECGHDIASDCVQAVVEKPVVISISLHWKTFPSNKYLFILKQPTSVESVTIQSCVTSHYSFMIWCMFLSDEKSFVWVGGGWLIYAHSCIQMTSKLICASIVTTVQTLSGFQIFAKTLYTAVSTGTLSSAPYSLPFNDDRLN